MTKLLRNPHAIHRQLIRHRFYPLLLCSALGCAFLAVRMRLTHTRGYHFLIWNLILAWIPYICAVWATRKEAATEHPWRRRIVPLAIWLAFFPNAPYLATDIVHFRNVPPLAWWYDLGMLVTFAWTGMALAAVSLEQVHRMVRDAAGRWMGWAFVMAVCVLTGAGIYVGRFLRWNSWYVVTRPRLIVGQIIAKVSRDSMHPRAVGVTLMYAALVLVVYLTFEAIAAHPTERERS
jgi:uncharacterized membrane protein